MQTCQWQAGMMGIYRLGYLIKCTTCAVLHICLKVMIVSKPSSYCAAQSHILSSLSALDAENELLVQEALERLMQGKAFHLVLHPLMKAWSVCLAPIFLSGVIIFLSSPINRENRRGHRSPSIHYPECKRCRCAGPAASSRVRPAHRAAGQQAGTVQETDGEAGVSTRRAETGPSLSGQEVQTTWAQMSKKSGGEVSVWKRLGVSQIRVGGRGYITYIARDGRSLTQDDRWTV